MGELEERSKFLGRKVLLTAGVVCLTAALAYISKMNGDVAMVFATAIGSLNYALRNSG